MAVKQFFMAGGNPFVQRGKRRVSATRDSSDMKWGEDSEVRRSVLLSWTCLWPWMSHLTLLNLTFLKQSGVVVLTSWNWYDDLMRQYMQSICRCPAHQRGLAKVEFLSWAEECLTVAVVRRNVLHSPKNLFSSPQRCFSEGGR